MVDKEKATAFAAYLSNVFTTPQANDNNITENIVKTFLDSACPMTLPITPFSPTEVKEGINKCKSHKAPGFDLITGQVLKELPPNLTFKNSTWCSLCVECFCTDLRTNSGFFCIRL
jgi:hypothetical protein